ncbi:MAG TPA: winged helix-turn-helix domain-containing protein, partial [Terriglobia bacterium]|nr:winged helix-turn-helix domain-containing protein [Terriglobia bacterium]
MSDDAKPTYRFKSFVLNVMEHRLTQDGQPVSLTPKAFAVLVYLVERAGHLVEKGELMDSIWGDSFVEEGNLSRTIHDLRRALGQDRNGNKFIETVPTKGYRFVALLDGEKNTESETDVLETQLLDVGQPIHETQKDLPLLRRPLLLAISAVVIVAVLTTGYFLANGTAGPRLRSLIPDTINGRAYRHYTEGRRLMERRFKGDDEAALEEFDKAIELDPKYADAYAGRADAKEIHFWASDSLEDISDAETAARKAIEIDPYNSYGHTILCRIRTTYNWDHQEGEKECRKAVEVDPNNHEAQRELGFLLSSLGHDDEAIAAMDRAIAAAPTSLNKRARGQVLYESRRYDDAITQLEQVDETDPEYVTTAKWLVCAYEMKGDYANALESYLRFLERTGRTTEEIESVKSRFEQSGWDSVLQHIIGNPRTRGLFQAGAYARLGDNDKAFENLFEMVRRRSILLVTIARDPRLD